MSNKFDNYTFRCSALGKIVPKSGKLTIQNKTYLKELFAGYIHNTRKEITAKAFEKGVWCEEDGITLLGQTLHRGKLILKNKDRLRNDFIQGEADCIVDDIIYDVKNAWDEFTFEKSALTWEYEWQLRGYMWLWKKRLARLFYALCNMPEHMVYDEIRKFFWREKHIDQDSEEGQEIALKIEAKFNYDHLELWERFKMWEFGNTDKHIDQIKDAVCQSREYLNLLDDERNERLKRNRAMMGIKINRSELLQKLQKV